jgi:hypothetical protein
VHHQVITRHRGIVDDERVVRGAPQRHRVLRVAERDQLEAERISGGQAVPQVRRGQLGGGDILAFRLWHIPRPGLPDQPGVGVSSPEPFLESHVLANEQ